MDGHNQQNGTQAVETAKLEARHEGHVVATAAVECSPEPHGTARIALERHTDDIPAEVRSELVDRVMDSPGVSNSDGVHVVLPLGDAASISRLQDRTTSFSARAAGASSVVDAEVPAPVADQ